MNFKFFSLVSFLFLAFSSTLYAESFCGSLTDVRRPIAEREDSSSRSRVALVVYNYEEQDNRGTPWNDAKLIVDDRGLVNVLEWKLGINFDDYLENDRQDLRRQDIQVCLKEFRREMAEDRREILQVASNPEFILLKRRGAVLYRGETRELTRVTSLLRERDELKGNIARTQDEISRLEEKLRSDRSRLESVLRDLEAREREEPRDDADERRREERRR